MGDPVKSLSYVTLSAAEVERLALACVRSIEAERHARDERAIERVMVRSRRQGWLGRLLKLEPPAGLSREEAVAELDARSRADFGFPWRSCYAWGSFEVAHALLRAARSGAATVNVTAHDLDMLGASPPPPPGFRTGCAQVG